MKMIIERDDGSKVEVREIESVQVDANVLIFFSPIILKAGDVENMENYLTQKIGKKCVIVDGRIQKVVGVQT